MPSLGKSEGEDTVKIQKDLLLGLYQDVTNHARHAEMLRANAVNYGLLVASILITVIVTSDNCITHSDWLLCIAVSLVGLFTALFAASYAELYFRNRARAERLRKFFDEAFFEGESPHTLSWLRKVDNECYSFRRIRRITVSTHWFWIALPLIVFTLGTVLTVISYLAPTVCPV